MSRFLHRPRFRRDAQGERRGNLNDQDVLLWNNQEVELPADHDLVHVLVRRAA